jgi:hypothetical protein
MTLGLPRVHAFELHELSSVPPALRETIVETLSRALLWGGMLRGLVSPFQRFLERSGAHEVLDLCAGAGGPARILAEEIARAGKAPPRFILTDLYPRVDAWEAAREAQPGVLSFEPEPVDATRIPEAIARGRARAIINAFHHFTPDLARAILADAVAGSAGVFLSEPFDRNPLRFLSFAPAGLLSLAVNPLLAQRDRAIKAALTWASPVALGACVWDGLVSTLRIYEEADLRAMVAPFGDRFVWEYGRYGYPPMGDGYYFFGVPTRARR